jgi:hypothetical protein
VIVDSATAAPPVDNKRAASKSMPPTVGTKRLIEADSAIVCVNATTDCVGLAWRIMVLSRLRDRQRDHPAKFASAHRNGLVAHFSASLASVRAGSWNHFLGEDIGGSGKRPASIQKNTFSDDRWHTFTWQELLGILTPLDLQWERLRNTSRTRIRYFDTVRVSFKRKADPPNYRTQHS